jgi:hypothetical protein
VPQNSSPSKASGAAPEPRDEEQRIPLTQLPRGATGRIACTKGLEPCDQFLLETLGLAHDTCVRVCRASGSCILEVGAEHGHTSRIAIAKSIADKVLVGRVDRKPKRDAEGA